MRVIFLEFHTYLTNQKIWLLFLDGLDDFTVLHDMLPKFFEKVATMKSQEKRTTEDICMRWNISNCATYVKSSKLA